MNQQARQDLAAQHYPLVCAIARRMARRLPAHVRADELEGDGSLGLMEAARRFEPERSVEFRTFAARRIKGAILDALRGRSPRGRGVERRQKELALLEEQLTASLGRRPQAQDFAAAGLTFDEVARRRRESARAHTVSLSEPEHSGSDRCAEERLASGEPGPESVALSGERRRALQVGVARLGERERLVLELYYFQHWTVKRIGALLGVSEARVSQIHSASLKKLRDFPELRGLAA